MRAQVSDLQGIFLAATPRAATGGRAGHHAAARAVLVGYGLQAHLIIQQRDGSVVDQRPAR